MNFPTDGLNTNLINRLYSRNKPFSRKRLFSRNSLFSRNNLFSKPENRLFHEIEVEGNWYIS